MSNRGGWRARVGALIVLALALLGPSAAHATTLEPIGTFDQPIYATSDPGNPYRLFVVERAGKIEQLSEGQVSTFADLSSVVSCCEGERGLLSIALAPDFDSSGRFYVFYTGKEAPGELHVAEMRSSGNTAALATLRNVLTIPHPEYSNHNGGQLQFGPDGYLYISTGDGGGENDSNENSQNLESLLGKILRINPLQSGAQPYTVPLSNPFALAAAPANTIWSYGLRNPFRFSFDRSRGDMVIGDVGQGQREEIDWAPAPLLGRGLNYGWNCREGSIAGPATDPGCSPEPPGGFTGPVFDYPHEDPGNGSAHGCAIIGGYVARDSSLGSLYGRYIYGDLCTGEIRSLSLENPAATDKSTGLNVTNLNSFGEDACGRLYTVSGDGQVSRLAGANPSTVCPLPPSAEGEASKVRLGAYLGIHANHGAVPHNQRAGITAWVTPCKGRFQRPVHLYTEGRSIEVARFNRACTAHFDPRITRRQTFRAVVTEDNQFLAEESRPLAIRISHRHPK